MSILLMSEIAAHRAQKTKELAYYLEHKERLEVKLATLRRDINLTDTILALIRKEQLIEVKR